MKNVMLGIVVALALGSIGCERTEERTGDDMDMELGTGTAGTHDRALERPSTAGSTGTARGTGYGTTGSGSSATTGTGSAGGAIGGEGRGAMDRQGTGAAGQGGAMDRQGSGTTGSGGGSMDDPGTEPGAAPGQQLPGGGGPR